MNQKANSHSVVRSVWCCSVVTLWMASFATQLPVAAQERVPCRIQVVDKNNGWPVPLVELITVDQQRYVTDNAGVVALNAPEILGRETWFSLRGHGYDVPADGFGMRGVRLTPQAGKTIRIEVTRTMIAQRLGRLTGAGLYAESQQFGEHLDWRETGLVGQDSVQNVVHDGKLFWAWGDTSLAKYPLGIFHMTGGTTKVQPLEQFEPPLKLPIDYFRDAQKNVRPIAEMPGEGPTWLGGFASLPDDQGEMRLVATYTKIRNSLEAYEAGLCVWNEAAGKFERLRVVWTKSAAAPQQPPIPLGHPVPWKDAAGKSWLLFGDPFPKLQCDATFNAWQDPQQWQVLKPQTEVAAADGKSQVKPHTGSIAYNAYRKKWVTVFMQAFGKPSVFGELWYAEADEPVGPWGPAVKVLSHDNYTFYNPRLHPEFTAADSPILLFEGTYTAQFADHAFPTARYDYNQILYRLDLDDPQLAAAQK